MACEDIKAKRDALEARIAQLQKELAGEPTSDRGPGLAALKNLSSQAFAVGQQYAACLAAHAPPTTTISVNGPQSTITLLALQTSGDATLWQKATNDQMDVMGNDFRGLEEIGTAPFHRGSNTWYIPDSISFWYPQTRPSDGGRHYKRTLAGKTIEVHISSIEGTYEDFDLNIDIIPDQHYQDLLTNAHAREYTLLMKAEYEATGGSHGLPNCDDAASIAEVSFIEAEIQVSGNLHDGDAQTLNDMIAKRTDQDICVYGPWIFDAGHCCHAEIHPAEQIWWRDDTSVGRKYTLSVLCDGSKRFWWRNQMDDGGTKLTPWGAPPVSGLFAFAFEVHLTPSNLAGQQPLVASQPLMYEVTNISDYNVTEFPNTNQTYSLVYQGKTLVQFIPHNDAFQVSFEGVGLSPTTVTSTQQNQTVRGFLVIRTAVGTLTQKDTHLFPKGTDPNSVPQQVEELVFEKVEGHYCFTIAVNSGAVSYIKTVFDLGGPWASGGVTGPRISVNGNALFIDMEALHRPAAQGNILSPTDISVTFPDGGTLSGKLRPLGTIAWSNGSAWTKVFVSSINTLFDLNGRWASGGVPGPIITISGNLINIDMSASNRPSPFGMLLDATSISVEFPDDKTYTGKLQAPGTIVWSNNSTWTKVGPPPIKTLFDLNGTWTGGAIISVVGNQILVDMTASKRPRALGTITDSSDITITFPDDNTYTAVLRAPGTIAWSNNSTWTKS